MRRSTGTCDQPPREENYRHCSVRGVKMRKSVPDESGPGRIAGAQYLFLSVPFLATTRRQIFGWCSVTPCFKQVPTDAEPGKVLPQSVGIIRTVLLLPRAGE